MSFELPKLNYASDALEPFIDKQTMEIHYGKHHQTYTDNFNKAIADFPEVQNMELTEIFKNLNSLNVPEPTRAAIKNQGGGYINHKIFWESLSPQKEVDEGLKQEIIDTFGSLEEFKKQFSELALKQFGSGWAWLVRGADGKLKIYSLPNQDSPYTLGDTPIFNLDVWEHAYYLKYQNRRAEWIENWWNVLKFF